MSLNQEQDILINYYNSARNELIARVGLRDNATIAYVTVVGALFGYAFSSESLKEIDKFNFLLIIPFVSLGFTALIMQHHRIIGALGLYCRFLIQDAEIKTNHWDNSQLLGSLSKEIMILRLFVDLFLILLPSTIVLVVDYDVLTVGKWYFKVLWIFGLLFTITSMILTLSAYNYRLKTFGEQVSMKSKKVK